MLLDFMHPLWYRWKDQNLIQVLFMFSEIFLFQKSEKKYNYEDWLVNEYCIKSLLFVSQVLYEER